MQSQVSHSSVRVEITAIGHGDKFVELTATPSDTTALAGLGVTQGSVLFCRIVPISGNSHSSPESSSDSSDGSMRLIPTQVGGELLI